jgi:hypothetical protein
LPHSVVAAGRRLVLASSATPLGRVWRLGYRLAGRLAATRLARRYGATVYLRGAAAGGHIVPGLSDIDLIAVAPAGATLPQPPVVRMLGGLVQADVYRADELDAVAGASFTRFGLGSFGAAYTGRHVLDDPSGLLDRPGILADTTTWRQLAGPHRRLPVVTRDRQATIEACWCELVTWWRFAVRAANRAAPEPSDAYLCVKLVAEPLRVLLALEGRTARDRDEALALGATLAPALGGEIEAAHALLRDLHRNPRAPLGETLPTLVALSRLITQRIAAELPAGAIVQLDGAGGTSGALPLADWRAVVAEGLPGARLHIHDGDPASLVDIRRISALAATEVAAIHSRDLLLEPSLEQWWTGRARTLQAAFTDPVSFALLAGSATAQFPGVPGWSAADWGRRAVAEWSAWLAAPAGKQPSPPGWRGPPDPTATTAATAHHLLGAARAALFSLSLAEGAPTLLLDPDRVAVETGGPAVAVLGRLTNGDDPRRADVDALREIVRAHLTAAARVAFSSA